MLAQHRRPADFTLRPAEFNRRTHGTKFSRDRMLELHQNLVVHDLRIAFDFRKSIHRRGPNIRLP